MTVLLRANSPIRSVLGPAGVDFLEHGVGGLTRILPHVEIVQWEVRREYSHSSVTFVDADKRALRLVLGLSLGETHWTIEGRLQRRKLPAGRAGSISRTIDKRERDIAGRVLAVLAGILGPASKGREASLSALRSTFDERVVAEHLTHEYQLNVDLGDWFAALRRLAEQTYENKALSFGCIIDSRDATTPTDGAIFPRDFLERKRFRALSDGYRTAYKVSRKGALLSFVDLGKKKVKGSRFYPEWCEDLAAETSAGQLAIALTRQGDLLVLERSRLSFTYRFGRWQYWNHAHVVDLIMNAARVQHVPPILLSTVVRRIYRAALDVSFRRTGGLFVLLRSWNRLEDVVRQGDCVDNVPRDMLDAVFDRALGDLAVQSMPRSLLAELAGLDGAVVLGNNGDILAYGAILDPKKRGRIAGTEGSRSKAAIGASNYGLAVKISSDGDMKVYEKGKELIAI